MVTTRHNNAFPLHAFRDQSHQHSGSPPIPPALILYPSDQTTLVEICVSRNPDQPLSFVTVTLAEAFARTKEFFAEVAADWGGDHGLIVHEDLPQQLLDLIDRLSADSRQQTALTQMENAQ